MRQRAFLDRPTMAYLRAVDALRDLLKAEGLDAAERAAAEALWDSLRQTFAQAQDVRPSGAAHVCIARVAHEPCPERRQVHWAQQASCSFPGSDHSSLWNRGGKATLYVTQPYDLSWRTLQEQIVYCQAHGLEMSVRAASWHFPLATVLVLVHKAGTSRGWEVE